MLLLLFGGGGGPAIDYGTGPTYFHIDVEDLTDPGASDWRVDVEDLVDGPQIASIMVDSL